MPATSAAFLAKSIGTRVVAVARTVVVMSVSNVDLVDREQRQAGVAHLVQHAVQCGLVHDGAFEHGGAVAHGGEGHSVEPGGPAGAEAAPDTDLVPPGVAHDRK